MTRGKIDKTETPDAAASEIADGDENPVDAIAAAEEIPEGGLIERERIPARRLFPRCWSGSRR